MSRGYLAAEGPGMGCPKPFVVRGSGTLLRAGEIMTRRPPSLRLTPLPRAWPLILLILLILACVAALPVGGQVPAPKAPRAPIAPTAPAMPKREPANVMSYEHADWLEREGRAETEKPEMVIQAMEIREGMTVAEIGAGTGFFSRRLAKAVGPSGKVYAEDIQP